MTLASLGWTLASLGWTPERQHAFLQLPHDGVLPGRIVGEHRTHFQVAVADKELAAIAPGALRNGATQRSDLPGVGDFVALRPASGDGPATIEAVLPRTNALIRKASGKLSPQLLAANIDTVFIVTGLDGDFNLARLERFLALVRDSGAVPVILVNKIDLATDVAVTTAQLVRAFPGVEVHAIGARAGHGITGLAAYFQDNHTVALIGSSGAGKSTLINQLLGRAAQATGEVRGHDSRGRHTTTHRQLFLRPGGGMVIDTPGMRGLETWAATEMDVQHYADIEAIAATCRFRDCAHRTEPGCAIRTAVAAGTLDAGRVAAFLKPASESMR